MEVGFCRRFGPGAAAAGHSGQGGGLSAAGLLSGSVIGLARMVAGSHFPSHVLWSGGFLYFTALLIAAPIGFWRESSSRTPHAPREADR